MGNIVTDDAKMATLVNLAQRKGEIYDEVFRRTNEAEAARPLEFRAVIRVQAWFRAQRVRSYLKYINTCASAIQRWFRGYKGRQRYRKILREHVFLMKLEHYNRKAVVIQKMWRGYYVRKYRHDYYSMKRYMKGLVIKNDLVRQDLEEYSEQQKLQDQIQREETERKKLVYYAQKKHHLLSTEVIPGIYNSPFLPYPQEIEFHLRNNRPQSPPKRVYKSTVEAETNYTSTMAPLPPVYPKPQGPFRQPREVQMQRFKPFQPSLRVATDFQAVDKAREEMRNEEWVTRVNDNTFQPFSRTSRNYEPMLHTTSKYGHLSYGNKYFREEQLDRHVFNKNFQTVVPPIPTFDKLNDTYSQGQV